MIQIVRASMAVLVLTIAGATGAEAFDVFSFEPGMSRGEVVKALAEMDVEGFAAGAGNLVVEKAPFDDFYEEQVVLFVFDDDGLASIHVRFLPEPGASGDEVAELQAKVKDRLVKTLGRPAWEEMEGFARGDDLLYGLSDGSIVRVVQWEGEVTIRAGIPRRVDGEVGVEILITGERVARSEEFWGAPLD